MLGVDTASLCFILVFLFLRPCESQITLALYILGITQKLLLDLTSVSNAVATIQVGLLSRQNMPSIAKDLN